MRLAPLAAIALAAAAPAATEERKLDMLAFFTGKSHAENVMKVALHGAKKLVVDSIGGPNKEGEFVLIDTVREEGKPVRTRTWVMRAGDRPGHYTGLLSDAIGPVDIVVSGDSATVRYVMKDGHLSVVQQMKLQADGKTLSNHVDVKRFGLKFARADGTIRKLD
ncbi:MAG: DUF3833 family protein [Pseudomonadota bacterium]